MSQSLYFLKNSEKKLKSGSPLQIHCWSFWWNQPDPSCPCLHAYKRWKTRWESSRHPGMYWWGLISRFLPFMLLGISCVSCLSCFMTVLICLKDCSASFVHVNVAPLRHSLIGMVIELKLQINLRWKGANPRKLQISPMDWGAATQKWHLLCQDLASILKLKQWNPRTPHCHTRMSISST